MYTLPATLGNLSDVEMFIVEYNNLTGPLPEEIEKLSRLRSLNVRGNQITGTIPNGIGQCTALEEVCAVDHI
jgi:Leucine-rich repeat (LRR) protein